MKKLHLVVIVLGLLVPEATAMATASVSTRSEPNATTRYFHGVITSVAPDTLSITSMNGAVTGRLDPARTKVTVHGKPGTLADLKVTAHAKAELCLDDVWLAVDAH